MLGPARLTGHIVGPIGPVAPSQRMVLRCLTLTETLAGRQ